MRSNHHIATILAASMLFLFASCRDRTPIVDIQPENSTLVKENMINANHVVIQSESTQIDGYIQRRGWNVTPLSSGARYWEYTSGEGDAINPDDRVVVTYRLETLDGSPIYTHQVDTLDVGRQQATVALDDLLLHLHYGSQAWLIAPSNSAYGVVGDGDRVPSRTVIIYNVTNIKKLK